MINWFKRFLWIIERRRLGDYAKVKKAGKRMRK